MASMSFCTYSLLRLVAFVSVSGDIPALFQELTGVVHRFLQNNVVCSIKEKTLGEFIAVSLDLCLWK